MNSPNTQKTITVFLILAALTSSFVFFLSNTNFGPSTNSPGQGAEQITLNGKSAFVESPSSLPSYVSPLLSRSDIGSNIYGSITGNFTDQLAQQLMASNPNGPDLSKANPLTIPKNLGDFGGVANLVVPSFMPQLQTQKIKVVGKYTYEDVMNYLSATQSAVQDILAPGLGQLKNESLTLQGLGDLSAVFDQAESKIYQTPVPSPLASFNRSLLGLVDVQRSFFDQSDPAKTLIALQNPELVIRPYQQAVQAEAQKLRTDLPKILSDAGADKNSIADTVSNLLGIQKAYAFVDIIGGPSNIINLIVNGLIEVVQNYVSQLASSDFWRKLFTEYLKDQLVHKLVQQVIQWTQGGGTPQFVQNWKGFLGDSFTTAASGIISKYAPGLCSSFRPLVQVALTPVAVDYTALNNPYACTPARIAGNFQDLQNSFADGGWVTYGYMLQPNNNIYGTLVQVSAAANQAGSQAQTAAQNKTVAGSGFLATKNCVDQITVTSEDLGGGITTISDAHAALGDNFISAACSGGSCTMVACNPNNPSAWQDTTPGKTIADTLNQNLGTGPLQRIVNAQDFTALITALVNSALTKLVGLGQKGLAGLTAEKLSQPGSLADTCSGLTGDALTNCQNQNSNINSTVNSSSGSQKDAVLTKIKSVLKTDGQLSDEANVVIGLINQTLSALDTASTTCAATLDAASSTIDAVNTLSFISQNTDQLATKLGDYQAIVSDLAGPTPPDPTNPGKIAELNDVLSHLQNDDIAYVAPILNIATSSVGDSTAQTEQFYSDLGSAVDNPGSTFGQLFGTVQSSGQSLADAKTDEGLISQPQSCGILEQANGLYRTLDNSPVCSISASKKYCTANGAP